MFWGFFLEPVVKKVDVDFIFFEWWAGSQKKLVWIPIFATFTHDLTVGTNDEK